MAMSQMMSLMPNATRGGEVDRLSVVKNRRLSDLFGVSDMNGLCIHSNRNQYPEIGMFGARMALGVCARARVNACARECVKTYLSIRRSILRDMPVHPCINQSACKS